MSGHAVKRTVSLDEVTVPEKSILRRLPIVLFIVGAGLLALAFIIGADAPVEGVHHAAGVDAPVGEVHGHGETHRQFYFSYLTSFMFWLAIAIGGLFFVLIHHGTRAGWSAVTRRIAENFAITLPLFVVLAIPVILGIHDLFHWSHPFPENCHMGITPLDPGWETCDTLLLGKKGYFDLFVPMVFIALGLLSVVAGVFYRLSLKQDETGDPKITHKMRGLAPIGIIVFGLGTTAIAINFMMSLDPHWYSTIFGVYYFSSTVMAIMAAVALASLGLQKAGVLKDIVTLEHYHDLGKFGYAFIVFWSYIAFSQFLLIWYANIPEETIWFQHRMEGGWEWITLILVLIHFVVPFFFMMSRHIKRNKTLLAIGCTLLLVGHFVDMFWLVQPNMAAAAGEAHPHFSVDWTDLLCFVGIGAVFISVFLWRTTAKPVTAINDPRLAESLAFENY